MSESRNSSKTAIGLEATNRSDRQGSVQSTTTFTTTGPTTPRVPWEADGTTPLPDSEIFSSDIEWPHPGSPVNWDNHHPENYIQMKPRQEQVIQPEIYYKKVLAKEGKRLDGSPESFSEWAARSAKGVVKKAKKEWERKKEKDRIERALLENETRISGPSRRSSIIESIKSSSSSIRSSIRSRKSTFSRRSSSGEQG